MSEQEVKDFVQYITRKNLALNKDTTVSGIEGGYNADGTLKYPQFSSEKAVDGKKCFSNSRYK